MCWISKLAMAVTLLDATRRLGLARIYLSDAGVWVLDDPTSGIDAEPEQQILPSCDTAMPNASPSL